MYLQYEDKSLRSRGQHLQMSETALLDELEAQPIQALDVQREILKQNSGQAESQDEELPERVKTTLTGLNEYFRYAWSRCEHAWHPRKGMAESPFRIYNFYETKKVYNVIMVVDQEAADLGIPLETKAMVGADHLSICKFDFEQDQGYQEVLQSFKTMTEQLWPDDVWQRKELEKAKASRPDKYIWDTELAEYPDNVRPPRKKAPLLGRDDWKGHQGEGVSNSNS
ncbi:hypothetical protein LTR05_002672 [Lithohypha guttulata]|uniref:Uncharacterized protein n=1 Tax=Lithohypha guttulata TaxID=1690604 RepID=A0AAN7YJ71_9EURO|nr:hypothetical protein LTR05_002672 [Lithohypha guttulata]